MTSVFNKTATAAMFAASMTLPASAEQLLCTKGGYNFAYDTVQLCKAGHGYAAKYSHAGVSMWVEVERTGAKTADITCDGVVVHHCVYEHRTTSGGGSGGWSGGESLERSQERSGEMEPGETHGPEGTDDSGNGVGFGAISG